MQNYPGKCDLKKQNVWTTDRFQNMNIKMYTCANVQIP